LITQSPRLEAHPAFGDPGIWPGDFGRANRRLSKRKETFVEKDEFLFRQGVKDIKAKV
jgi:hypothetical protein